MAIAFRCPSCSKALRVRDDLAGLKGKCPSCGVALRVPAQADLGTEPPTRRSVWLLVGGLAAVGCVLLTAWAVYVFRPREPGIAQAEAQAPDERPSSVAAAALPTVPAPNLPQPGREPEPKLAEKDHPEPEPKPEPVTKVATEAARATTAEEPKPEEPPEALDATPSAFDPRNAGQYKSRRVRWQGVVGSSDPGPPLKVWVTVHEEGDNTYLAQLTFEEEPTIAFKEGQEVVVDGTVADVRVMRLTGTDYGYLPDGTMIPRTTVTRRYYFDLESPDIANVER